MSFAHQIDGVYVLCGLMQHRDTRHHLIKYVFFNKITLVVENIISIITCFNSEQMSFGNLRYELGDGPKHYPCGKPIWRILL